MMSKCLRLSISILAFLTGWVLSASYLPTLALAFLIGMIVPLFTVGSVPYRVLAHGCAWRTALGKASLASLFWALATALFLPFGIFLYVISTDIPDPLGPTLTAQFIHLTWVATYGLSGAAICRWMHGRGQEGDRCGAEKSGHLERAA